MAAVATPLVCAESVAVAVATVAVVVAEAFADVFVEQIVVVG